MNALVVFELLRYEESLREIPSSSLGVGVVDFFELVEDVPQFSFARQETHARHLVDLFLAATYHGLQRDVPVQFAFVVDEGEVGVFELEDALPLAQFDEVADERDLRPLVVAGHRDFVFQFALLRRGLLLDGVGAGVSCL